MKTNKQQEILQFDKPLEVASFMRKKTVTKESNMEERLTLQALILTLIFTALVFASVQLFGAPRL